MHTEEEAKAKLCCGPMALHPDCPPLCHASGCMAWRWGDDRRAGHDIEHWRAFHPGDEEKARRLLKDFEKHNPTGTRGYCGLAGKP